MSEKILLRNNTSYSYKSLLLATSFIATMAVSESYGFENNLNSRSVILVNPNDNCDLSDSRLREYTIEHYSVKNRIDDNNFLKRDLEMLKLMREFEDSQVEIDSQMQKALDDFDKISGSTTPSKKRF